MKFGYSIIYQYESPIKNLTDIFWIYQLEFKIKMCLVSSNLIRTPIGLNSFEKLLSLLLLLFQSNNRNMCIFCSFQLIFYSFVFLSGLVFSIAVVFQNILYRNTVVVFNIYQPQFFLKLILIQGESSWMEWVEIS